MAAPATSPTVMDASAERSTYSAALSHCEAKNATGSDVAQRDGDLHLVAELLI